MILLRFDGRSTAHQRAFTAQSCNALMAADPPAAVTQTYLFNQASLVWWFGVAVMRRSRSTQLLYIKPG